MLKYLRVCRALPAIAALLLTACETRRSTVATETAQPQITVDSAAVSASSVYSFAVADTAAPYSGWEESADTARTVQVQLEGKTYYISTSAQADSTKPLTYISPATSTIKPDTVHGVEVDYTLVLRDAQQRPVFTRHLTKQSFVRVVNPFFTTQAFVDEPAYLGYWPRANALVFWFDFILPDSDYGSSALLALDATTGQTRHCILSNYSGGSDADVVPTVSPNGRVLLTAYQLLDADGRNKPWQRQGYAVAGACFINDQIILVDYEPENTGEKEQHRAKAAQTILLDLKGKTLKTFAFSSNSTGGLGYSLAYKYLRQTRTHYFYDQAAHALLLVPQDQPLQAKRQLLNALQPFQPPQRATEVKFGFYPETDEQIILWADTISGQLRYQRRTLSQ